MSTIEKTFNNGEVIIKEGDTGNTFYQLLDGNVAVYKNYGEKDEAAIATLGPGQYFGEMAVIETYPRSTTVVAEGDVKVTEISADELNEYITQHPDKIIEIMRLLGNRLKAMTADYNEVKKVLDDVRKADSKSNYESFFANMMKKSIFLTAKNGRLERPSVESLREASEAVRKQSSGDEVEAFRYGTIIFKEGEVGKCMYIVHSGSVTIYSNYGQVNELKLTEVTPVACFGELGLISGEQRSATAVVESSEAHVEIIYPEDLENIFKTCPVKIDMILKNLSYRLRSITYDYFRACQEIYKATGHKAEDD